jgi:hypothetical protein
LPLTLSTVPTCIVEQIKLCGACNFWRRCHRPIMGLGLLAQVGGLSFRTKERLWKRSRYQRYE